MKKQSPDVYLTATLALKYTLKFCKFWLDTLYLIMKHAFRYLLFSGTNELPLFKQLFKNFIEGNSETYKQSG